jgi:GNAT superfamily N-acetyltransferase
MKQTDSANIANLFVEVGAKRLYIRKIRPDDAEAAARLSSELGYPASTDVLRERIESIIRMHDHTVLVASVDDAVVGWIDIGIVHHLQAEPSGEIGGLVVGSGFRSQGIGQRLVAEAEEWIRRQGVQRVVVRSRMTRERAHHFYLREGYSLSKTSAVFTKQLERC